MQDIFKKRCFSTQIRQDEKNICYNVNILITTDKIDSKINQLKAELNKTA